MMIEWLQNIELQIVSGYDEENDVMTGVFYERFYKGQISEIDITKDRNNICDIQFGDGSMAYAVDVKAFTRIDIVTCPQCDTVLTNKNCKECGYELTENDILWQFIPSNKQSMVLDIVKKMINKE